MQGIGQGIDKASQEKKVGQIEEGMKRLSETIEGLSLAVQRMGVVLAPILIHCPPESKTTGISPAVVSDSSALAGQISEHWHRINRIADTISNMIERCEL